MLLYPYNSLLLFSLSLLSVYRLLLWGWGLRTERVYITLSQPCTVDLFFLIIIMVNYLLTLHSDNYKNKLNSVEYMYKSNIVKNNVIELKLWNFYLYPLTLE